ncbi:hypothetical protein LEP1GSC107_1032 [Leptospira interrogans serovar Grippotyphosa str. UI 12769]|uniref:Uncharacterized protein n=3 Tax=Leptospira interrogans TaxID=173 RepID=A0A0E2D548_LEPIR|nr:hypothetical protein LEP1GSC007_4324 [Leptospira interrogans serovar Bulgarica str. Mallika]EKO06565.1 hypothetical protein LEP1GSC077_2638 [Leptospira interrogans str. C10069]EKR45604.1 hypothetical protein LEP1GSC097_4526 [Leptospira interrogans serovar Grippotyphosa str. UI 08368]EKR55159.1 hypothetical protein LEP1GSC105_2613 [Leptospira interrogans str. UI 12758]EMF72831.1 hypothetical protein LEP1GSC148_3461 [Leptospira interrogans serovar Canicola str. LT1962]EMJ36375.1 hypothetical 
MNHSDKLQSILFVNELLKISKGIKNQREKYVGCDSSHILEIDCN